MKAMSPMLKPQASSRIMTSNLATYRSSNNVEKRIESLNPIETRRFIRLEPDRARKAASLKPCHETEIPKTLLGGSWVVISGV